MKGDADDPKALIREAYRIDGISAPECRSIFLDWALSTPDPTAVAPVLERLIDRYQPDHPDHPMTTVLKEGLEKAATPKRRGGRASRLK